MLRSFAIIFIAFVIVPPFVLAQTKSKNGSKPLLKAKTKKPARIISLGVINSRAIDLMIPVYPLAAFSANVYGQVQVNVIIDESGRVSSAAALNGHPLLRPPAVRAALTSTFEPFSLNGERYRINGTIFYNYLPKQWSWLEIGYALTYESSYYSIKNLVSQFPTGFSEESRFLREAFEGNWDWDKAVESTKAMVRSKLTNDVRSMWLFETGSAIATVREKCCRFEHENQRLGEDLNALMISAPNDISAELLSYLRQLANLIENKEQDTYSPADGSRSYQLLNKMEQQFPWIGR